MEKDAAYRAANIEQLREYDRQRYLQPERNAAQKRGHVEKYCANKAERLAKMAEYAKLNPEIVRRAKKAYKARNPAKTLSDTRRRQARKLNATPAWANQFFIEEAYDLARRRAACTGIEWHVDHIVPLQHPQVQGLHVEHNLQVIPASTNYSKGNRTWPGMP